MNDGKPTMWTLQSALVLYRELVPIAKECGYGMAIAGSVMAHGYSTKDLDLVLFPLTTATEPSKDNLMRGFGKLGLRRTLNHFQVQERWRRTGSQDRKRVEIWRVFWEGQYRRIDLFFLRE